MKKILKRVLLGLLSVILILILVVGFVFRKDIQTIASIKKIDDYGMYYMDYYSDYGLDELIAQGGVENDGEIVDFAVKKILKGLPVEFNIPDFGCSTFQVQNSQGQWLFGRNYDLNYVPSVIIKTTPKNGYASIAVGNLSVLGYNEDSQPTSMTKSIMTLAAPYIIMDGLNEKGLSIGVLLIKDNPTNQTGKDMDMTTTSAIRYVLDKAKNVEEAITLFETMDMHASANADYHFQIADAEGNSAIIEYIGNELSVIRKGEKPMQLTNFIVSDANYGFGKGQDRYETILNSVEEANGIMEMDQAMDVLQSVSRHSDDSDTRTQWSVVYNNTDLSMQICAGAQFDQVYTFYPFAK